MTKVDPPRPIKKRQTARVVAEFTRPMQAVGIAAPMSTNPNKRRAPYLSQRGPFTKRKKIVPRTEAMLEVQISCFVILKSYEGTIATKYIDFKRKKE
jgi:hypothetical protein